MSEQKKLLEIKELKKQPQSNQSINNIKANQYSAELNEQYNNRMISKKSVRASSQLAYNQ